MQIPIENIYYLLCYAWNMLEEKERVAVAVDDKTKLLDLFAKVLINASKLLFKKGIERNYITSTQEVVGIKGKLEVGQTFKSNLFFKLKTISTYDEFSDNILLNQILVSTFMRLLRIKELDQHLVREMKLLLWRFSGIEQIDLNSAVFKGIKLNRNNKFYGFIINVCQIIFENSLPTEEKGVYHFTDFTRDERKMNRLFEAFVRNFYRIEFKNNFHVRREIIRWQFESGDVKSNNHLPQMETDISLENDTVKIIIDAKFYRAAMASNFGREKIKSENLYQLFSYLLNQETSESKTINATGILLYPTTVEDYNFCFKYKQHPIFIKTVNLNTNWRNIDKRLKEIITLVTPFDNNKDYNV